LCNVSLCDCRSDSNAFASFDLAKPSASLTISFTSSLAKEKKAAVKVVNK